ncbi:Ig-like domain-containing protein [Terriglobus aquaticus]|uniref:Ig-like domain repeat protein n=1 Tax=Terriglobus aquaticus TaxID=940139 RepID=A0ABW9KNN7_9BACT|nr:Ig-like domain-containing protein [Terriglobus aquaticus]
MSIRSTLRGFATALLPLLAGSCALAQIRPVSVTPSSNPTQQRNAVSAFGHLPLGFQPNRGQSDPAVQFVARTPESTVYLTGADAVLETATFGKDAHGQARLKTDMAVRMHLVGGNATPSASTGDVLPGTVNYLRGNDHSQWHTGLPQYNSVSLAEVYPGVDLKYYGHGSTLEYDFVVAANADPTQIQLQFQGTKAHANQDGGLVLPTANGSELRFDKPVAYQQIDGKRVPVAAEFQIADGRVGFKLGSYDHSRDLVIDPTLVYTGTLGTGVQQTNLSQIAVASSGELYMLGTTNDSTFPVTANAYQGTCGPAAPNYGQYCSGSGQTAAFVAKLSADGTSLVYATYLSGTQSYEYGDALTVDSAGVAYLFGRTGSDTFPVTPDAFQAHCIAGVPNFPGGVQAQCDGYYARGGGAGYQSLNTPAYFAKLSADGSRLLYSSYLGGTTPVYPNSIQLDATGNIYLSGQVNVFSTADLTPGQLPTSNSQFPGITSSGYLTVASAANGHGNDQGIGIAAFLSKFSNDGHTLLYGTFFGDNTTGADTYPTTMTVGANGVAFLGGYTDATNLPVTAGAIKAACTSPGTNYGGMYCNTIDGYVAAIDTTKSGSASLVYSTRLGGTATSQGSNIPDQQVLGLVADSSNNVYVTGYTFESTFPVGTGGFQATCPNNTGNIDPTASGYIDRCDSTFVVKLNTKGTQILAGTFLGGPHLRSAESKGYQVRLDSKGQVYVYGYSSDGGGDFPQVNPLQAYHSGNNLAISTFTADLSKLLFSTRFTNPSYQDHSVSVAGGLALDGADNIYFTGATTDTMFAATTGTYQTAATTGAGNHPFFVKLSKVLQPTQVTASATPNPASQGANVTYKAVVAGLYQTTPALTGTVTFQFTNTTPATKIGTGTVDSTGTATFTGTAPAAGTYTLTASYGGDTNYDVSTSSAVTFTANSTATTSTTVLSSTPTAPVGSSVSFTAAVTSTASGTPTGTVTFYDGNPTAGGTQLGTGSVTGAHATFATNSLAVGTHTIYAVYGGDTNFAASTGSVTQVIVQKVATTTQLTSSAATAATGAAVTLTATVTAATTGVPTGTVTFLQGTTTLGTGTLNSSGVATLQISTLPVGSNSIVASYGGDSNFLASNSAAYTQTITAATIAISVSPTTLTVTHGSSGTATITATPTGAYSGALSFSCGTLPSNASCSFQPATLTFSSSSTAQTTTLTFSTQAATQALLRRDSLGMRLTQVVAATLFLPLGLAGFAFRRHRLGLLLMLVVLTTAVAGISGCGGSSTPSTPTTPVGTYTVPLVVTVNGTTSTTPLTVVVQ